MFLLLLVDLLELSVFVSDFTHMLVEPKCLSLSCFLLAVVLALKRVKPLTRRVFCLVLRSRNDVFAFLEDDGPLYVFGYSLRILDLSVPFQFF